MASRTYALDSACFRSCQDISDNQAFLLEETGDYQKAYLKGIEEFAIECSIIKVLGTENVNFCSDEGIQIYGGMGYSKEAPMEKFYRDVRVSRIYEGTNEINRMIVTRMLFKRFFGGDIDIEKEFDLKNQTEKYLS